MKAELNQLPRQQIITTKPSVFTLTSFSSTVMSCESCPCFCARRPDVLTDLQDRKFEGGENETEMKNKH